MGGGDEFGVVGGAGLSLSNGRGVNDAGEGVGEEVVEEYELDEYTRIRIVRSPMASSFGGSLQYVVDTPQPNEAEREVLEVVRRWFIEEYPKPELDIDKMAIVIEEAIERFAPRILRKRLKLKRKERIDEAVIDRIKYMARRDIVGFGKLEPMLKDPNIEDIHVLGIGKPVFVWHRTYENLPTNVFFVEPEDLERHLQKMMLTTGKFVSLSRPIVDGTLPMGYRINVVHSVVSELGTAITIRKYKEIPFTVIDLVRFGTLTPELVGFLWVAMENKRSVFIVGETAAGKTTLLNAVATLIPLNMKVVVIEEVREIRLPHPNSVFMVTREGVETLGKVTLYDLVKTSLRQRPDYIIVGEVRGEEAYVLLQAISLGHGGLGTMHAEGVEAAVRRLMAPPMNIPPYLMQLLDVIVHISKVRIGSKISRYVLTAAEISHIDPETKEPELNVIYKVSVDEREGARLERFAPEASITLRKISEIRGLSIDTLISKVYRRADFIRRLALENPPYEEAILKLTNYRD